LYLCIIDGQRLDEVECVTNVLPDLNQIDEIILEENKTEAEDINENGNYKINSKFLFVKF
jgi:hypothetical protein